MEHTIVAAYPDPENGGAITYVWSHGAEVWQENGEWRTRRIPHPSQCASVLTAAPRFDAEVWSQQEEG